MSGSDELDIPGIDLSGDRYTVTQSVYRNKYRAEDESGNVVLRAKQKLFKLKEEFPFVDADGNEVFTVKAQGMMDVAGNYGLVDPDREEAFVILDNDFSFLQDTWRIREAGGGSTIAAIESRGALYKIARQNFPFGRILIPHKYEITDVDGNHVGSIDGRISLRDRYDITIDDATNVPKEPVIAAAMVIDAIQQH